MGMSLVWRVGGTRGFFRTVIQAVVEECGAATGHGAEERGFRFCVWTGATGITCIEHENTRPCQYSSVVLKKSSALLSKYNGGQERVSGVLTVTVGDAADRLQ
jgi:hypothetical protein